MDEADQAITDGSQRDFLDTLVGEISFFKSVLKARPIGMHRQFHVLTIRQAIFAETGVLVSVNDIWDKLSTCYDLDLLESNERENGDDHNTGPGSHNDAGSFTLPLDDPDYQKLMTLRHSTAPAGKLEGIRKKGSRAQVAGLVSDSESSELTETEDPEEQSTMTAKDGIEVVEVEDAEQQDVEMTASSPAPSTTSQPKRGRRKSLVSVSGRGGSTQGVSRNTRAAANKSRKK